MGDNIVWGTVLLRFADDVGEFVFEMFNIVWGT